MKRLMRYSLLAVSLAGFVAWRTEAKTVSSGDITLTVCLMNDVAAPEKTVEEVEKGVAEVFAQSGISIRWIRGGDEKRTSEERWACSHPEALRTLILRWMGSAKAMPNELAETFLDANGTGVIADVFADRVMSLHWEHGVSMSTLLTYVSAHELGHLLLGLDSHSASGLMLAKINHDGLMRMSQAGTGFTQKQGERMHERMKVAEAASLAAHKPQTTVRLAMRAQAEAM